MNLKLRIARMNVEDVNGLRFIPDDQFDVVNVSMDDYSEEYNKAGFTVDGKTKLYLIPSDFETDDRVLLTSAYDDEEQRLKINDLFDVFNSLTNIYYLLGYDKELTLDCAINTSFDKNGKPKDAYFIGFGDLYPTYPMESVTANFTVIRYHKISTYRINFNEGTNFLIKDNVLSVVTDGVTTEIDLTGMSKTAVHKLMNAVIMAKEAANDGLDKYSNYASALSTVITVQLSTVITVQ